MIKIPALLKPTDTAGKLTAARAAQAEAEAKIELLTADRVRTLAGDDAIDAIRRIDREIEGQRGERDAWGARMSILEARLEAEQRKFREQEHVKAVDRFEAMLPACSGAAAKLESAIEAVAAAARELRAAGDAAHRAWPPGLVAWGAHCLDGSRIGDLIQECFSPGGLWRRQGERIVAGPSGSEYAAKAVSAGDRAGGFARRERQNHEKLMADLRAQPVPHPEPALPDDDEQVAA